MGRAPVVVGISDHSGWAVFVSVAVKNGAPVVVDRRRVELIEPGLPKQPYEHDTQDLGAAQAEEMVREVRESAVHCAERALSRLRSALGTSQELVSIALRKAPLPHLPRTVAEAHASYPVMCRADAMLYHDAICKAAASLGVGAAMFARGQESQLAGEALGATAECAERLLADFREALGPPWQKDHRTAAAWAIAALSQYTPLSLPRARPNSG